MTFVKNLETGSLRFRPVAVVDIGSNSVRLVVYDGLRRAPTPVVNEKILCGLGRAGCASGCLGSAHVASVSVKSRPPGTIRGNSRASAGS